MKHLLKRAAAAGAIAAAFSFGAVASASHVGLTLGKGGTTLVQFNITNASTTAVSSFSGDANRLDAIDFRPATGELIGYSSSADEYYLVNPLTGATTLIANTTALATATTNGPNIGIDFNPTIDRLRTVSSNDDNIVFNPNDGGTTRVTDLFYAAGDPNDGVNPNISGNAYANSVAGALTTQQYALDYGTNSLTTLANNSGVLSTIGQLTVGGSVFDFDSDTGFDIFTSPTTLSNTAYGVLTGKGLTGLFIIDLMTGAASQLGVFANNLGQINGLAVGFLPVEVPLPAALPLFFAGIAGLGFAARSRRRIDAV